MKDTSSGEQPGVSSGDDGRFGGDGSGWRAELMSPDRTLTPGEIRVGEFIQRTVGRVNKTMEGVLYPDLLGVNPHGNFPTLARIFAAGGAVFAGPVALGTSFLNVRPVAAEYRSVDGAEVSVTGMDLAEMTEENGPFRREVKRIQDYTGGNLPENVWRVRARDDNGKVGFDLVEVVGRDGKPGLFAYTPGYGLESLDAGATVDEATGIVAIVYRGGRTGMDYLIYVTNQKAAAGDGPGQIASKALGALDNPQEGVRQMIFRGVDGTYVVIDDRASFDVPATPKLLRLARSGLAPLPTPSPTAEVTPGAVVRGDQNINLRKGPGSDYDGLGPIAPGATMEVVATTEMNGQTWYQVKLADGRLGWVREDLVEANEKVDAVPRASDVPQTSTPQPKLTATPRPETTPSEILAAEIVYNGETLNKVFDPEWGTDVWKNKEGEIRFLRWGGLVVRFSRSLGETGNSQGGSLVYFEDSRGSNYASVDGVSENDARAFFDAWAENLVYKIRKSDGSFVHRRADPEGALLISVLVFSGRVFDLPGIVRNNLRAGDEGYVDAQYPNISYGTTIPVNGGQVNLYGYEFSRGKAPWGKFPGNERIYLTVAVISDKMVVDAIQGGVMKDPGKRVYYAPTMINIEPREIDKTRWEPLVDAEAQYLGDAVITPGIGN